MAETDNSGKQADAMLASLAPEDRKRLAIMRQVRAKYFSTPRDALLSNHIKFLIERSITLEDDDDAEMADSSLEARGVVLTGASGAGKTTALKHLLRKHPAFPGYGNPGCPLVTIKVPAPCTLLQLGRVVLKKTGYPLVADKRQHIIWEMVRDRLKLAGIRFLHFDQVQTLRRPPM